jgi:hypothetical protein
MVIAILLAISACQKNIELSSESDITPLVGTCLATTVPLFLLNPKNEPPAFRRIVAPTLVPQNSALAPYSVNDYENRRPVDTQHGDVIRIIPAGSTLTVHDAWRLQNFEGSRIALRAKLREPGSDSTMLVETSSLLHFKWSVFLLDGVLEARERAELGDAPVFDRAFAVPCNG